VYSVHALRRASGLRGKRALARSRMTEIETVRCTFAPDPNPSSVHEQRDEYIATGTGHPFASQCFRGRPSDVPSSPHAAMSVSLNRSLIRRESATSPIFPQGSERRRRGEAARRRSERHQDRLQDPENQITDLDSRDRNAGDDREERISSSAPLSESALHSASTLISPKFFSGVRRSSRRGSTAWQDRNLTEEPREIITIIQRRMLMLQRRARMQGYLRGADRFREFRPPVYAATVITE
jgi:hypothetical protein